ncbi:MULTISPECIES: helix-turn-helix transcriptional regulator [Anaerotruncus]|jgi:plasmid maintenance system antidote protein VapI|uniref:helix-turn-helix transcriptional regulator n=1 Tax=Anaerotruncus TaxID=244127 RepID=UPI00082C629C|nr:MULTISPECIES: helix-turn-helix transcriptional regulator [Anaerotruncus]RGX54654.1 XRE family transcriptional regulator [Anaerotruncus sp. AF02-27]
MFSRKTFGERLLLLTQKEELTPRALAMALNVSEKHIEDLTNGKATVSTEELEKFSAYFLVTQDYLLGLTDRPQIAEGAAD